MPLEFTRRPSVKKFFLYTWSDKELTKEDRPEGSFSLNNRVESTGSGSMVQAIPPTIQTIIIDTEGWSFERTRQPRPNMSEWRSMARTHLMMGGRILFTDPEKIE